MENSKGFRIRFWLNIKNGYKQSEVQNSIVLFKLLHPNPTGYYWYFKLFSCAEAQTKQ